MNTYAKADSSTVEKVGHIAEAEVKYSPKGVSGLPWDRAPEWANWAAADGRGNWWWFESRPSKRQDICAWDGGGNFCYFHHPELRGSWRDSLQQRPE